MRGKFIVLEGLDRSGKSTQVDRLIQRLEQDGPARLQKFPDRTTSIGKMIDAYLQSKTEMDDRAIHLLFSANRWECSKRIREDIAKGITVVADRYAFSGIAFSAAKVGETMTQLMQGLPFDYCLAPDEGLPLPDVVINLSLSPEDAAKRGQYGEEKYETLDMQERTRAQFKLVAREMERRHPGRWKDVDAAGSVEEVGERIRQVVGVEVDTELGQLWM